MPQSVRRAVLPAAFASAERPRNGAFLGQLERVAQAAVDLEAVVDPLLRGDLVGRSLHHDAAHAGVDAARVLADDDVVHRLGRDARDRRRDAGVELHRAQVDVLVEVEAELEEDVLLEDAGGDVLRAGAGEADRAEVDRVELAQLRLVGLVDEPAGLEIVLAAEGEDLRLEAELELLRGGLEDLEALADDFGAGAVAGDDCDVVGFHGRDGRDGPDGREGRDGRSGRARSGSRARRGARSRTSRACCRRDRRSRSRRKGRRRSRGRRSP